MKKKIFFIAGVSSDRAATAKFIAASKKIRLIIAILKNQGHEVVHINSAPEMGVKSAIHSGLVTVNDEVTLTCVTIPRHRRKKIGRLRNIFEAKQVYEYCEKVFGVPDIVWCYNAYAFEMRFVRIAKRNSSCSVILEFEDWHFARSGLFNIKALLDWFFWFRALSFIDHCYAVNSWLKNIMSFRGVPTDLLPGIVSDEIRELARNPQLVRSEAISGGRLAVGYFGGLTAEKGAQLLIKLIEAAANSGDRVEFHVSGSGDLADEFASLATRYPKTIKFYGFLSDRDLTEAIANVSIILNPHYRIAGVFPFKLIEGVACGRIILSAPLGLENTELAWMLGSIVTIDGDVEAWRRVLEKGANQRLIDEVSVSVAQQRALELFSQHAVDQALKKTLNEIGQPNNL